MEYALYSYLAHVITFWTAGGLFFLLDLKTEDSKKYKKFKIRKKKIDWNFYEKTAIDVLYTHLFVALPFNILISPLWEYFGCTWESIHYTLFDLIIILLIEEIIFF